MMSQPSDEPDADRPDGVVLSEEDWRLLDRAPYQRIGDALAARWHEREFTNRAIAANDVLGIACVVAGLLRWVSVLAEFWLVSWPDRLLLAGVLNGSCAPIALGVWLLRRHRGRSRAGRVLFVGSLLFAAETLYAVGWSIWAVGWRRLDPEANPYVEEALSWFIRWMSYGVVALGLCIWLWPSRPDEPTTD